MHSIVLIFHMNCYGALRTATMYTFPPILRENFEFAFTNGWDGMASIKFSGAKNLNVKMTSIFDVGIDGCNVRQFGCNYSHFVGIAYIATSVLYYFFSI